MNDQTSYAFSATDVYIQYSALRGAYVGGVEVKDADGNIAHGNGFGATVEEAYHASMLNAAKRLEKATAAKQN